MASSLNILELIRVLANQTDTNKSVEIDQTITNYLERLISNAESESSETELEEFRLRFAKFHGFGSLAVCLLGIVCSVLFIVVLLSKKMRTPTNLLLIALDMSNLLTFIPYVPLLVKYYIMDGEFFNVEIPTTSGWTNYDLVATHFTATSHTSSIWIGVSLAVLRFFQVRNSDRPGTMETTWMRAVKVVVPVSILLSVAIHIPLYYRAFTEDTSNEAAFRVENLQKKDNILAMSVYAVMAKLLPCMLMTIFGVPVIYMMYTYNKRSRLTRRSSLRRQQRKISGTKILLCTIFLFVISELPQGVLILLCFNNPHTFAELFRSTGDLQDFVALLTSSTNLFLYCAMSREFRKKFRALYCRCAMSN